MPQPSRGYADLVKHRGYASLLTAQALSVFNDNAFKYVLSLVVMARAATMAGQNRLIAFASALFVLPYILFSTYAGQAADRYSKRSVIVTTEAARSRPHGCGRARYLYRRHPLHAGRAVPGGHAQRVPGARQRRHPAPDAWRCGPFARQRAPATDHLRDDYFRTGRRGPCEARLPWQTLCRGRVPDPGRAGQLRGEPWAHAPTPAGSRRNVPLERRGRVPAPL